MNVQKTVNSPDTWLEKNSKYKIILDSFNKSRFPLVF